MKRPEVLSITALLLCVGLISVSAKVAKSTEPASIQIDGLECRIERTDCTPDEWLRSCVLIQFRTTNGKGADIRMNLSTSTFSNCEPILTKVYAPANGSWSLSGLKIEAASNTLQWNYDLDFEVEWR